MASDEVTLENERGSVDPSATKRKPMPVREPAMSIGATAGRYVVVEELGSGAMGAVYRAYDPELQREVALKRLRPDAADEQAAARLILEARAMARLSHPNVVAVYDVVADDEGVTLALECLDGGTLADWLRSSRPTAAVVQAMLQAGRGLAAAHRAGLVHRDFKPSNVLIAADGTVKVTDFGLVKVGAGADPISHESVSDAQVVDDQALTQVGTVLGTPRFMAPEQVAAGRVDARGDQYAFCVAFWAALAGKPPFTGQDLDALQRARLRGPPPLPRSVRVSSRIARALERGLAVDPQQRWPDMDALLVEIEPPSATRGRQVALGLLVALPVGLLALSHGGEPAACEDVAAGLDDVWSEDNRAAMAEAFVAIEPTYARRAWKNAESSLNAYVDDWRRQRLDACEAVHERREQTVAQMDLRVGCLQQARARVVAAVEVLRAADESVAARASDLIRDLPPLQRCSDLDALARGRPEPVSEASVAELERLEEESARAQALLTVGRYDEVIAVSAEPWERSAHLEPHPIRTRIGRSYAAAMTRRGRFDEGVEIFRIALRNALAARADHDAAIVALDFAHALTNHGDRGAEALWLAELGAGIAARPEATTHLRAKAASGLGQVYRALGQWDIAAEHHRQSLELRIEAFGEDHRDVAVSRNNLGLVLYHLDRPLEAIDQLELALRIWREQLGDDHPEVATARNNLAMVLERADRPAEAEAQYREALRIREATLGPSSSASIAVRHNLGLVMMTLDRDAEAEAQIREAIGQWAEVLPGQHPYHAVGHNSLGLVLRELGRRDEEEQAFRTAVELGEVAYGPEHPQMCQFWNNLARTLMDRGQRTAALDLTKRSLALCDEKLGREHASSRSARDNLAELLDPAMVADASEASRSP